MSSAEFHQVQFTWPHLEPSTVIVTGTFDKWSSSIYLTRTSTGFEGTTSIPWGEKIKFKFVVDGQWIVHEDQPTEVDPGGFVNNVYTAPLKSTSPIETPPTTTAKPTVEDVVPVTNGHTAHGHDVPEIAAVSEKSTADSAVEQGKPASNGERKPLASEPTRSDSPSGFPQLLSDLANTIAARDGTSSALGYVASGLGAAMHSVVGVDPINMQKISIPTPKPDSNFTLPDGQESAPPTAREESTPESLPSPIAPIVPIMIVPVNAAENNTLSSSPPPQTEFATPLPVPESAVPAEIAPVATADAEVTREDEVYVSVPAPLVLETVETLAKDEAVAEEEPVAEKTVVEEEEAITEKEAVAEEEPVAEKEAVAEEEAVAEKAAITQEESVAEKETIAEKEPALVCDDISPEAELSVEKVEEMGTPQPEEVATEAAAEVGVPEVNPAEPEPSATPVVIAPEVAAEVLQPAVVSVIPEPSRTADVVPSNEELLPSVIEVVAPIPEISAAEKSPAFDHAPIAEVEAVAEPLLAAAPEGLATVEDLVVDEESPVVNDIPCKTLAKDEVVEPIAAEEPVHVDASFTGTESAPVSVAELPPLTQAEIPATVENITEKHIVVSAAEVAETEPAASIVKAEQVVEAAPIPVEAPPVEEPPTIVGGEKMASTPIPASSVPEVTPATAEVVAVESKAHDNLTIKEQVTPVDPVTPPSKEEPEPASKLATPSSAPVTPTQSPQKFPSAPDSPSPSTSSPSSSKFNSTRKKRTSIFGKLKDKLFHPDSKEKEKK